MIIRKRSSVDIASIESGPETAGGGWKYDVLVGLRAPYDRGCCGVNMRSNALAVCKSVPPAI